MMLGNARKEEKIVGVDIFIQSEKNALRIG
jgi:hypothetical protein